LNNIDSHLKKYFEASSKIFQNEEVFEPSYIPNCLIHREEELSNLARYFRPLLTKDKETHGKYIIIYGSVGSGKTAVVKKFGATLEQYSKDKKNDSVAKIAFFHLNCRRERSWNILLTSILRQMISGFPLRGYSASELLEYLGTVTKERNQKLLLCLDEIDYLLMQSKDKDILYALIRNHETIHRSTRGSISLILITRNPNFQYFLDNALFSSLSKRILDFPPYTQSQLLNILKARAKIGLKAHSYSLEILNVIASIADKGNDARYAIELLWRAAKIAEGRSSTEILYEHVRKAQVSIFPVKQSFITDIPLHQQLVLLALASLLQEKNDQRFVLSREIRMKYSQICKTKGITPRKTTQFWLYLQELHKHGFLQLKVINRHKDGTSLGRIAQVSINDLPVDELTTLLLETMKTTE
jgi:cell division control protein 6